MSRHFPLICDLRDNQPLFTVFSQIASRGQRIDGLVNSDGTLVPVDLDQAGGEHCQEAFQIHVAAVLGAKQKQRY